MDQRFDYEERISSSKPEALFIGLFNVVHLADDGIGLVWDRNFFAFSFLFDQNPSNPP
ncbi:MAG: hypothetical protein GYA34_09470 [Chloroflexi bacterium]|nr:hypothetical protein [Chloroflexota bacterium]